MAVYHTPMPRRAPFSPLRRAVIFVIFFLLRAAFASSPLFAMLMAW